MKQHTKTAALLTSVFVLLFGLIYVIAQRLLSVKLDPAGLIVIAEIIVLLLITVVPAVFRFRAVGVKAVTEPLFLMGAACLFYYVFRGLLLLFRHSLRQPELMLRANPASNTDLAIVLGYVIVGLCMFHIGYRFWNPPASNFRNWPTWSTQKVNSVAVVTIGIACISTLIGIHVSGGIGTLIGNFGCLRVVTAGYGYALLGLGYWSIAFAFLLADRLRQGKSILVPLMLLGMSNICDAFMGNRSGMLATWITGFLLYVYSSRGQKVVRSAALLVVVLTAIIGFVLPMAHVRQSFCLAATAPTAPAPTAPAHVATATSSTKPSTGGGGARPAASSMEKTKVTAAAKAPRTVMHDVLQLNQSYWTTAGSNVALGVLREFVALDSFSTIVAVGPKEFPFRYGGTYLDSVLFVIPRAIWPAKPRSFGLAIGRYLFAVETDIPPGYIGELYINFHVAGVAVGMYLLGLLLRKAHQWTINGDPVALTVYSVVAPYLIFFMGRSFIGGGTLTLIPCVLMLPVIYFLRRPSNRDQQISTARRSPYPDRTEGRHGQRAKQAFLG
jgi:O-antigen polysaccharide polymerase Wzy-like protein